MKRYGRIHRTLVWLSRINRCRGFGIQSPWAYSFVCDVINGDESFDGHSEKENKWPRLSSMTRKMERLYMRISGCIQPAVAVSFGASDAALADHLRAGCRTLRLINVSKESGLTDFRQQTDGIAAVDMLLLASGKDVDGIFRAACLKAREGSVFILEDIHRDATVRRLWREVVQSLQGVVTFDLYYCGLVCFKSKLYKCNYVVNF